MEDNAECMLVLIGATPEGKKELVGFQTGVRESAQSWRELLIDIKQRGLEIAPDLAVRCGVDLDGVLHARARRAAPAASSAAAFLFSSFLRFTNSAEELGMALGRFERSVLGRRWRVGSYGVASSRPRLNLEALGASRLCARSTWHDMRFGRR